MSSLTQVPFILVIYYLMQEYEGLVAVSLIYFISLVQLIAIIIYMHISGYYFLDVPKDARILLIARSFMYGIGLFCFVHSLRFISPVTALCAQGTTVVMNTCLIRVRRAFLRKIEFGYLLPAFCIAILTLSICTGQLVNLNVDIVLSRNAAF